MKRVVTLVGMISLLSGCASGQAPSSLVGRAESNPQACAPLSQEQELSLNLAQKTADEGRLHAALANLERLPAELPQARLSKARILRSLNRPEARELYASLVDTCLKAQGEHGLGQLASAQGRHEEALNHLRLAASLDPTSDTIRNDLGVVYMNLGRMDEARFELLTALELNEAERQPALNLLTLLIYQGRMPQADALAQRMGFSASQLRTAQDRAKALRTQLGGMTGAAGQGAPVAAPATQGAAVRSAAAGVAPLPVAEARAAQPVAAPARASRPAVAPAVVQAPKVPGVPAPQLSNFRPAPVVPLSVASAAARLPAASSAAAPAPAAARVVSATAPTATAASRAAPVAPAAPAPSAPRQVAAVPAVAVMPPAPAVPRAPVPAAARVISVTAPTATTVSSAMPVAPAAPAPSAPRQAAVPAVATKPPVPATAPVAQAPAAPVLASTAASPRRALIEMRPGRLIVPDDGGFVRVEPLSTN